MVRRFPRRVAPTALLALTCFAYFMPESVESAAALNSAREMATEQPHYHSFRSASAAWKGLDSNYATGRSDGLTDDQRRIVSLVRDELGPNAQQDAQSYTPSPQQPNPPDDSNMLPVVQAAIQSAQLAASEAHDADAGLGKESEDERPNQVSTTTTTEASDSLLDGVGDLAEGVGDIAQDAAGDLTDDNESTTTEGSVNDEQANEGSHSPPEKRVVTAKAQVIIEPPQNLDLNSNLNDPNNEEAKELRDKIAETVGQTWKGKGMVIVRGRARQKRSGKPEWRC